MFSLTILVHISMNISSEGQGSPRKSAEDLSLRAFSSGLKILIFPSCPRNAFNPSKHSML